MYRGALAGLPAFALCASARSRHSSQDRTASGGGSACVIGRRRRACCVLVAQPFRAAHVKIGLVSSSSSLSTKLSIAASSDSNDSRTVSSFVVFRTVWLLGGRFKSLTSRLRLRRGTYF